MQEGGSHEWSVGSGNGTDWEEGGKEKDTERNQGTRDVEEVVTAEIEWPCGVCESNVSDDGLKCVECEKWCHVDCSDVVIPAEYEHKPFTCPKCSERHVPKTSKAKDGATLIKRTDRPKRSISLPRSSLRESSARIKRNIREVESPDKELTDVENKGITKNNTGSPDSKMIRMEEGKIQASDKKGCKKVEKDDKGGIGKTNIEGQKKERNIGKQSENNRVTNEEGGEKKTNNKKGEKVGDKDKKTTDIANKNEEGEKSEKELKQVENKNGRKKETSHENKVEEENGKDIEIEKKGKKQEKSKTKKTENNVRNEEKMLGSNTEIIIKEIEFTKEDIKSLNEGEYLTCTGISMGITYTEEEEQDIIQENKILLIRPEIAQIFQHGDRKSIEEQKEIHKTKKYDWIFFPVNKNRPGEVYGGVHWSLLIFSKREHAYYHFDPVKGINEKYAKKLMINLLDEDSYDERGINLPVFFEGDSAQQTNGYDCGPYVLEYMRRAVYTIGQKKGRGFGDMHPEEWILTSQRQVIRKHVQSELARESRVEVVRNQKTREEREKERTLVNMLQETIAQKYMLEETIAQKLREEREKEREKEVRDEDIEIISEKISENEMEITEQTEENDWTEVSHKSAARKNNTNKTINKDKNVCSYWITDKCKFGQNCKYEHPTRCREHMDWGKCKTENCELAHPKMCRNMIKDSYCSRSKCWFNHPTKIKNRYVFRNEKHGQNYYQNQGGPKRQDNQNMQGNPNMGNPTTWQKNNHMDRYQYPNSTPFLVGPTPYEAYKDPNRDMNVIMKIGQMFQTMSSQIMNMHW